MSYSDYLLNAFLFFGMLACAGGGIMSISAYDVKPYLMIPLGVVLSLVAVFAFATLAYRGDVGLI